MYVLVLIILADPIYSELFCTNKSSSDSSDMILFLLSSCRFPAAENNLSDGTEVAGEDKNVRLVLKESEIHDCVVTTINNMGYPI